MKIVVNRSVDEEMNSLSEWFIITEKVFKFFSWMMLLSILRIVAEKSGDVVAWVSFLFLSFFIGKLLGKFLVLSVKIEVSEEEQNRKMLSTFIRAASVFVGFAVTFIALFIISSFMGHFLDSVMKAKI